MLLVAHLEQFRHIEQKTEEGLELKCLDGPRLIPWLIGRIVAVVHR